MLTVKKRIYIVMTALLGLVFAMLATPFFVTFGVAGFSRELMEAFFIVMEFLGTIYLLNEFNRLRIIAKKQEFKNEKLINLENNIRKLTKL